MFINLLHMAFKSETLIYSYSTTNNLPLIKTNRPTNTRSTTIFPHLPPLSYITPTITITARNDPYHPLALAPKPPEAADIRFSRVPLCSLSLLVIDIRPSAHGRATRENTTTYVIPTAHAILSLLIKRER